MKTQVTTHTHILIGMLLMISVSGCAFFYEHQLSDGRFFPRHPNFTVTPYYDSQDPELDFSAVYTWERIFGEGTRTNYFHFRFWSTGECIEIVSLTPYLNKDEVEGLGDLKKEWNMGFFNKSGSSITVETYGPNSYNRSVGFVSSNEIHITLAELKYTAATFTRSTPVDWRFIRHHIGELSVQPDWTPTGMIHRARQP